MIRARPARDNVTYSSEIIPTFVRGVAGTGITACAVVFVLLRNVCSLRGKCKFGSGGEDRESEVGVRSCRRVIGDGVRARYERGRRTALMESWYPATESVVTVVCAEPFEVPPLTPPIAGVIPTSLALLSWRGTFHSFADSRLSGNMTYLPTLRFPLLRPYLPWNSWWKKQTLLPC